MAAVTDRAVSAVHLISVTMGAAKKQNFIRETPALGPTPRSNPLPFTPDMWQKCPGVLGLIFAGYVPLASQNPYPIIVRSRNRLLL